MCVCVKSLWVFCQANLWVFSANVQENSADVLTRTKSQHMVGNTRAELATRVIMVIVS